MAHVGSSDNVPVTVAQNFKNARLDCFNGEIITDSLPLFCNLALSSKCNMSPRCVMCLTPHSGEFISQNVLDKVSMELFPYLLNTRLTADGEPTMYPSILEVVRNIYGWAFLQTNGLRGENYDDLIPQLHEINFSVDAATAATYREIRGPYFDRVIGNIRKAVDIRDRQPHKNPRIFMDFVLMRCNQHEMAPFIELAKSLDVTGVYFCPLFPVPGVLTIERQDRIFAYSDQIIPREELIILLHDATEIANTLNIECGGHVY